MGDCPMHWMTLEDRKTAIRGQRDDRHPIRGIKGNGGSDDLKREPRLPRRSEVQLVRLDLCGPAATFCAIGTVGTIAATSFQPPLQSHMACHCAVNAPILLCRAPRSSAINSGRTGAGFLPPLTTRSNGRHPKAAYEYPTPSLNLHSSVTRVVNRLRFPSAP